MKRVLYFLISSCTMGTLHAQEEIFSDSLPSAYLETIDHLNKTDISTFLTDQPFSFKLQQIDPSIFDQALFPAINADYNFRNNQKSPITSFRYDSFNSNLGGYIYPYRTIYSQAYYQINNHFSFGGNSFGSNALFESPKLNPSLQDQSIKGASLYFQYKVSDKFKIQTRLEITNKQNPYFP